MKKSSFLIFLIIGMIASSLHADQVYRWVDEGGKVHFGDKPQGTDAKSITVKQQPKISGDAPATQAPTSSPTSQERLLNAYGERHKQKKLLDEKKQQEGQKIAAHEKECEELKDYLATTSGTRIYNTNEKGERVYLSDAEIDASRAKHQADLDKYCR